MRVRHRITFAALSLGTAIACFIACGARTELPAPDAGGMGGSSCPSPSMVVSASIGGNINHQFVECFEWPDAETCPSEKDAPSHLKTQCGFVQSVDCGPERRGETCCYLMTETCAVT